MGRLTRLAAAVVLLAMTSGHVITAACEITCLNDRASSPTAQSEGAVRPPQSCHESAPESSAATTQVAPQSYAGCHGDGSVPFVLTAKHARDRVEPCHAPIATHRQLAAARLSAHDLRDHTPPGLDRAPIVPLRI